MWEYDTKNEFIYLVKPPGICSYLIYCRLYQIKPKLIQFGIWRVTLYLHNAHIIEGSKLHLHKVSYNIQNIFDMQCQYEAIPSFFC